ncbi:baeRF11 domain-containing protein [Bradyrhizobium sp. AZCC 2230]|uniref:baeRF11 domain-containing protein n=1 Tax=Bradyrhizobium sp. AZCC 2230 TaxID=3117021 RepID=UPI002FF1C374
MLHIEIPSLEEFKALAQVKGETCVSLYLPTSPLGASAKVNRTAFKDLAKDALSQLKEAGIGKVEFTAFAEQFDRLAGVEPDVQDQEKVRRHRHAKPDPVDSFWHYQANGLAVLATSSATRTLRLPNSPKPLAEVADRFHLTPLIRAMTSRHDIYVLALAKESVRLVHAFANLPPERLQVPGLPANAGEATRRPSVHVRAPSGHLQNLEGEKVLLQQYVRKVEQAVYGVLAKRNTALVLAAAEPLASMFRSVNTYPGLAHEMIEGNPDQTTDAELEDAAIPILDRLYSRDLAAVIARYDELKPRLATTDVSYAAHAATAGAIDQLLVDLDAVVPGLVSDVDGSVTYAASDDAETYSVVDEVARRALYTGARVMGARREELPDRAPLTAILRYAFH